MPLPTLKEHQKEPRFNQCALLVMALIMSQVGLDLLYSLCTNPSPPSFANDFLALY